MTQRTELKTVWRCAAAVALLLVACKPAVKLPSVAAGAGPQIRATVITIRTTIHPAAHTSTHTVVIGPELARSTDEADRWRLYDFARNRVLFVDDLEKSFRTESLDSLSRRRATALRRGASKPAAEYTVTPDQRTLLGLPARRSSIRMGAYRRDLWVAAHPLIPAQLFALMHSATMPSSPNAAMAAEAEQALMALRGFPLLEQTELAYGKEKLTVERAVVSVEQKNVPQALLEVPRGYRDVTAPTAPAANRRPASSRPPGRTAPAAE